MAGPCANIHPGLSLFVICTGVRNICTANSAKRGSTAV